MAKTWFLKHFEYPLVTVEDREPPQLVDAISDPGYEVEVKRLPAGDFEGRTTIGEITRGRTFSVPSWIVDISTKPN